MLSSLSIWTVSLLIQTATAWEPRIVNGEMVRWSQAQIGFEINTDNAPNLSEEEVETAVVAAAKEWDGSIHDANTQLHYDGLSKKSGADLSDGTHIVSFDTTWNQDPSLLAVTHVWSDANHDIVHFDIEINADGVLWATTGDPNKHDLHNTMTHEFGHALGLEHSDDIAASMASTTSMGELSKRDVHNDDIQGFVSLYPMQDGSNTEQNDPAEPPEDNQGSGSNGGVDNALIPAAGGSGGSGGPVSLEKAGCTTQPYNIAFWMLGIIGLLPFRRR